MISILCQFYAISIFIFVCFLHYIVHEIDPNRAYAITGRSTCISPLY